MSDAFDGIVTADGTRVGFAASLFRASLRLAALGFSLIVNTVFLRRLARCVALFFVRDISDSLVYRIPGSRLSPGEHRKTYLNGVTPILSQILGVASISSPPQEIPKYL